ncbi:rCG32036 [Rattus norvegicus]|uniref:Ubiquitin carboxyl-terminal hydrolase n=2 Tax=Rattus norvegicus TaxID=10116 RepID=D4AEI6_RAT|nr:ubiquitin carboxyl-terminal hydrolase 29 [Rattus norvegicus]XP_006228247.1 ubiquitin carboxyl-terminal hydrolase 29 isoform X1 [Rattus norvegicus]XP_038937348.1 ubiquitin carboxyl-terminal hydrolase 29 isoform X1 [Rattus norvegicus]XP_038937353.1 ubiquitin carboxyl-terminal hydrolase 29 isoform X1 [Rattus norvegicus]XP_038937359.1 ubiquitin carboxyl-terminal hydrolase 29 isoform X1 [Rattus norvegicus]XP_038937365.1 ubiquitin carboxyl-terminal hydrolase 29 isoform X1 [Rattus norvegicus]EDL8|eukprot:NP_001101935.1 ubiquitin carboxyl-terminal hydrolase 29 [Rattus norvegicus]
MAHLKIHGLVQIRSTNRSKHTRASQWKEAVIEIVERKQKVNLVVSFKLEERRRVFQLGDNVTGVVVSGELGLYHLDLTLRDDTSLLIDKLSSADVEHLKSFLDSSTPCESQQPMESMSNQDTLEISDPFFRENQDVVCVSLNTALESGTLLSRKMPLCMSNTTGSHTEKKRGEKQGRKRKTEPSPSTVEVTTKDILKENNPEQKKKSRRYYSRNRGGKAEKAVALREQEKRNNWKLEPAFSSKVYGKSTLDGTVLPIATCSDDRDLSIFGLEIITHNGIQPPPDNYLKQLKREGFPNLGNTCYMNSILQSVFGIPTFAKDLLTQGIPWEKVSYDDLIMPLSQLLVLKDIRDIEIKGELLTSVKKSISTVADTFSGNEQNDAHEFLSLCLDQLKLNMEKVNAMWDTERKNEPTCAGAKRFVCPVGANFEFELHSSIICEGCGEATLKTEVSNYLSIDLHHGTKTHPLSIQKSFDLFFTPEKIEHNCEKCKNKNSVLKYTLRRLPRVLIVHLKRYQVTTDLLPVKSEQPVEISQYLNISSHCHENRKLPFPLINTPPKGDYDIPNVSPGLMPEIFSQSMSSKKVISESSDPLVLQVGSSVDAEIQSFQIMYEDESEEEQQRGLESGSMLDPELLKTENRVFRQKISPAPDSMMGDGYSFLPMLCEPMSIQDPGLAEMGLQEVPENPEFKYYGKPDGRTNSELSKLHQNHGGRIKGSYLPASFANMRSSLEDPEKDLSRSSEFEEDDPHSFALGSDESKDEEMGDNLHNYRLVSVVSHFGSSPNSGHYVSDVYDFQRQAWLLYSDVQVFENPDPSSQENRLHTGYIFFYMHNEIFEELLKKASECKVLSTSKEEKRDIDYFSTLLNGLTYILEEF